jgi:hypothetical protein
MIGAREADAGVHISPEPNRTEAEQFLRNYEHAAVAGAGGAVLGSEPMTMRTSRKSVTFTRPFSLSGIDEVQPPGTYVVETDEELLPDVSFPAYRRVATLIWLCAQPDRGTMEQVVDVDPLELQAAQERDASGA